MTVPPRRFPLVLFLVAWVCACVTVAAGPVAAAGDEDLRFRELWRAGGAEDEVFFGHVYEVLGDEAGNVYVLDLQLVTVFVYSPEGSLLRQVGSRGEGPGEVNNVNSMVLLGDERLGLGQALPGRLAILGRDGTPVEKISVIDPDAPGSGFVLLMESRAASDFLVLAGMRWLMDDEGQLLQRMFLRGYGLDGTPGCDYWNKESSFDATNFVFDEAKFDFPWSRFAILADETVVFAPHRNGYEIRACGRDGEVCWTTVRPCESVPRDAQEMRQARLTNEAIGSHYGRELQDVKVEKTEPDILDLWARPDGSFWVRTSQGDRDRPEGVLTTVDVFDSAGNFSGRKRIRCPGEPSRDGIHVLPDGRLVVVTGAVDAYRREVGSTTAESMGGQEIELEVVCYGLD